jgi:hypothetical protein
MNAISSKFDNLHDYLRKKLYSGTKLQLITSGRTIKFPRCNRFRFILPTTKEYEFGSYNGTTLKSAAPIGSNTLHTDNLPRLNGMLVVNINNQKYGVIDFNETSLSLYNSLNTNLEVNQQIFFDTYVVTSEGNYEDGFSQLLVSSNLPIIPGDQWYFTPVNRDIIPAIVLQATKTQNSNQWDVILDRPIISNIPSPIVGDLIVPRVIPNTFQISTPVYYQYTLNNGNYLCTLDFTQYEIQPLQILEIWRSNVLIYRRNPYEVLLANKDMIQVIASSSMYWDSIPVDGPCIVSLPIATHLQNEKFTKVICYIQTLSGKNVVTQQLTLGKTFKVSTGIIPAASWSTAQIIEGLYEYLPGLAHFIPTPKVVAKLTFLDSISGKDINTWKISLKAASIGNIIFYFPNNYKQKIKLHAGLNTLIVNVPQEDFSWVEIFSDVEIYLGSFNSASQISYLNLAMHVYKSTNLGSHIFGRPSLHSLVRDPSLTWSKVGLCKVNSGYTLTPSSDDYEILKIQPTIAHLRDYTRALLITPTILNFTPINGYVGDMITITGTNLLGTLEVEFS